MTHYTLLSGGGASWKTAKWVQSHHPGNHVMVFTDTLYEDADTYRFLVEGAANVKGVDVSAWLPRAEDFPDYRVADNVPLEDYAGNPAWRLSLAMLRALAQAYIPGFIWLCEGRDPWEVFRDERYLGNSGVDPCSKFTKREFFAKWRDASCQMADVFWVGIGSHEAHRFDDGEGGGIGPRMALEGWDYRSALLEETPWSAVNPSVLARLEGIKPGRNYAHGYIHDNCGGFCVKGGHAHWKLRRRVQPDRYRYDAMMEQKVRTFLGKDVSILTDRRGGDRVPMTLAAYDQRLGVDDGAPIIFDVNDSCGACMLVTP